MTTLKLVGTRIERHVHTHTLWPSVLGARFHIKHNAVVVVRSLYNMLSLLDVKTFENGYQSIMF